MRKAMETPLTKMAAGGRVVVLARGGTASRREAEAGGAQARLVGHKTERPPQVTRIS